MLYFDAFKKMSTRKESGTGYPYLRFFVNMKTHVFSILLLLFGVACCNDSEPTTRTYYMGFQNSAPRVDNLDLFVQSLNLWTPRADAAMITTEVPWQELLDGTPINTYILNHYSDLVIYYRSKNLKLWIYIDPQNGLDRTADALDLQAVNKSIADTDMQLLYQKFTVAMDSMLHPDHLGLALETNLIREAAPASIYEGVKNAANATAAVIKTKNPTVPLSISVQADFAWGKLGGGTYRGVAQDFTDFPFMQELGISSYPYFGFDNPVDIPLNYYSRLVEGKTLPVFISEGGWSSASVTTATESFISSPDTQRDYITHHHHLLNDVKATAVFQLLFTDLDVANLPSDVPDNINYFAYLGLVDKDLQPKVALTAWDDLFKKRTPITK
jgi:hypothetical protein